MNKMLNETILSVVLMIRHLGNVKPLTLWEEEDGCLD